MKKLLLIATLLTASCAAWAQGKVRLVNDSLHMVYFSTDASVLRPGDDPGQAVPAGGTTYSGVTLKVDLWGGTSATSLTKLGSTAFGGPTPGVFTPLSLVTPFAGGTTNYFQVQVYDGAFGSLTESAEFGSYFGESSIFTTVVGASVAYNSIVQSVAPAFSTWAPGDWELDSTGLGPGALGAIELQTMPEPSSTALLALGAVALLRSCGLRNGSQRRGVA